VYVFNFFPHTPERPTAEKERNSAYTHRERERGTVIYFLCILIFSVIIIKIVEVTAVTKSYSVYMKYCSEQKYIYIYRCDFF
jgi:hypothetical protein